MTGMTTEEEVREYCEQRQIVRPHINYTLALLLLFLYESSVEVLSYFLYIWGSESFSFFKGKETMCYWGTQLFFFFVFGRWIGGFVFWLFHAFAPGFFLPKWHFPAFFR